MTFYAEAGKPYRLWLRGKAESNSYNNDSVYVQFSGSTTGSSSGAAAYRIGTTSAAMVSMEDCTSCGLSGWGWQDNASGAGVLGAAVYFAQTGPQTLRIQVREDGLSIDQVVLSPGTFLSTVPGLTKNDTKLLTSSDGSAVISPSVVAVTPDSGTTAGGNQVTISGEGFLNGAVATIGGMAATAVIVVDYNTITATVPAAAAGAANIIVSNPSGLSNTLTNGYTYTEPPSVTLGATPTGGTAPMTIVFDAVASDPEGASLTYDWNFGDGTVILNSTAHIET
ncbi:MAG: IPT/TIG domain-containing protein [Pyrinomonadaceae bacterium]